MAGVGGGGSSGTLPCCWKLREHCEKSREWSEAGTPVLRNEGGTEARRGDGAGAGAVRGEEVEMGGTAGAGRMGRGGQGLGLGQGQGLDWARLRRQYKGNRGGLLFDHVPPPASMRTQSYMAPQPASPRTGNICSEDSPVQRRGGDGGVESSPVKAHPRRPPVRT